jgi:hypothetical protein
MRWNIQLLTRLWSVVVSSLNPDDCKCWRFPLSVYNLLIHKLKTPSQPRKLCCTKWWMIAIHEKRQVMADFKVLLTEKSHDLAKKKKKRAISFSYTLYTCLHSQPPVLSGPARVWSCVVRVRSEVWRHMTRVVRHRVAGRSSNVGVEVGAWVGPVGCRRREDASCNKKTKRIKEEKINTEVNRRKITTQRR